MSGTADEIGCLCVNDGIARLEIVWLTSAPIQLVVGPSLFNPLGSSMVELANVDVDENLGPRGGTIAACESAFPSIPCRHAIQEDAKSPSSGPIRSRILEKRIDTAHLVT